jgi:hypothetical protein
MADKKISQLTAATLPLTGTEEIAIVQGGETKKVTKSNLDFIPLTGTEFGKPITGILQFNLANDGDFQIFYNNGIFVGGISHNNILGMVNVLYKGDNYTYYLQDGVYVSIQTAGSESDTKFLYPSTVGFSGNLTFATREWANVNFAKYGTTAPASATATGTTGEIRVTSTYIYWCYATNQWGRAASTW